MTLVFDDTDPPGGGFMLSYRAFHRSTLLVEPGVRRLTATRNGLDRDKSIQNLRYLVVVQSRQLFNTKRRPFINRAERRRLKSRSEDVRFEPAPVATCHWRVDRMRSPERRPPQEHAMVGEPNINHVDRRRWKIISRDDNVDDAATIMCRRHHVTRRAHRLYGRTDASQGPRVNPDGR
jgi:hypothetical protein